MRRLCRLVGHNGAGCPIFGNFLDLWTWIGAAVVIASGRYTARREQAPAARYSPADPKPGRRPWVSLSVSSTGRSWLPPVPAGRCPRVRSALTASCTLHAKLLG